VSRLATAAAKKKKKRKTKKLSCAAERKQALRLKNKRKRKAALKKVDKRCAPAKKPAAKPKPQQGTQPAAVVPATPPGTGTVPAVPPAPPVATGLIDSPIPMYRGTFGPAEARRLLWRAGFGPRPGQAEAVAAMGLEAAVTMLTRPTGTAAMQGPEPRADGSPLDPLGTWGHDHLWWMDRMVRSSHQLVERMALVFHDWFATTNDSVGSVPFMLAQSNLFRTHGLGNFRTLTREVTRDNAMLVFLSGLENRRGAINENYARELMELFCLGADRGAYTETDVRELARAMTGWTADWSAENGIHNVRWLSSRWDTGAKTVFGKTGKWTWEDGVDLVVNHPMHPSFFVRKLWSYFVPVAPSAGVAAALEQLYVSSGYEIRPVLEAILCSPELLAGPAMVKPPVVFAAGLLRAIGDPILTGAWSWLCAGAGQQLFYPPDVSGWDDERWLDTSTMYGRWQTVNYALNGHTMSYAAGQAYSKTETPEEGVAAARAFWNDPTLRPETVAALNAWSANALSGFDSRNQAYKAQRQTALRMLLAMSPDHQVC